MRQGMIAAEAEGQGGESGESGTQYARDETARESRAGVDLVMAFDAAASAFRGTVTNTTAATVSDVRVEIHLSNGVELGPTPRVALGAGEVRDVELSAAGQTWTMWSVHVEIGGAAARRPYLSYRIPRETRRLLRRGSA